ncbi:MAG: type II secretion system protein GspE, partial [Candidatus Omnitrophica bacterium]|nr:type II secretion system protein GspE [Candidatus Omnitrophota bacterium]
MTWRIGEILIQKKLITWEQLSEVLVEQKKTKELTGEILVRKGFISYPLLYKALAEQRGIPFVDLGRVKINPKAVESIPRS